MPSTAPGFYTKLWSTPVSNPLAHTETPPLSLQKRLSVVARLPKEDQVYIAKTIDMLAERRGIARS
jgi:hypothetical protein